MPAVSVKENVWMRITSGGALLGLAGAVLIRRFRLPRIPAAPCAVPESLQCLSQLGLRTGLRLPSRPSVPDPRDPLVRTGLPPPQFDLQLVTADTFHWLPPFIKAPQKSPTRS